MVKENEERRKAIPAEAGKRRKKEITRFQRR